MFQRLFACFGYVPAAPVDPREAAKAKLVKALSRDKYRWRSIDRLVKIAGMSESETRGLLTEIGARTSYRDSSLFGLRSRVGETGRRY